MATRASARPSSGAGFHALTRQQLIGTMAGLMLTLLLAALDQTIVGTAMPRIIAQLNGFDRYAWVTTAYLLTSTAAVPIFGKLSDIYGRKWFYMAGATLFVIASALCGAAGALPGVPGGGMNQLIAFRALQGLAGGIIIAITFTIIGDIFPPAERGKYQGLTSAVWGMASVFGPTLGGWITDRFSWRWIFYVNLPVGAAAITTLFFAFPYFRPEGVRRKIDWAGVVTLVAALVPLLLALTWVTDYGWGSARVIGFLAFAAVMSGVFLRAERRAAEPILPLVLFKDRIITISAITAFLTSVSLYSALLFIPLFMQSVIGVSATQSGSLLTPLMVTWSLGSIGAGQIVARIGRYKGVVLVGLASLMLGTFLLAGMREDTSRWVAVRNMIFIGIGLGLTMPISTLIVQNAAPQRMIGAATSLVQFFRQIGSTVGAAVFGSIMLSRYRASFDSAIPRGTPANLLAPFSNPLQLANLLPRLRAEAALVPNGPQILQTLLDNVRSSLVHAIDTVFMIGAALAALSFVLNFALKEIPLRKTLAHAEKTEAIAPEGAFATNRAASDAAASLTSAGQGDD